ncbi:MAG: nucleotidyltransferase family protein [Hyphomicrobiales bacterium]
MDRDAILDALRQRDLELRPLGVTSLYLYGSMARNEARPDSDVDLFVDPDYDRFGFVELFRLEQMLTKALGRKVEITTRNGLHPLLRSDIERDAIKVL